MCFSSSRPNQKRNADSSGDVMETVKLGFDMALQVNLLLYSLILGAFLGAFFDLMRISRVFLSIFFSEKTGHTVGNTVIAVVSFFEDIIFFAVSAAVTVLFCFQANGGSARGFILLGVLGGFSIYLFTLGRLTKLISEAISRLIYRLLSFVFRRILSPIAVFFRRLAAKLYKTTLGRAVSFVAGSLYHIYTEKSSRELNNFCSRQFIK